MDGERNNAFLVLVNSHFVSREGIYDWHKISAKTLGNWVVTFYHLRGRIQNSFHIKIIMNIASLLSGCLKLGDILRYKCK